MYNRQILVEYYNGKRRAGDLEVEREFRLLKQQAEIDWRAMYFGKDTSVAVEGIEEDYIYNAQLTAKTQRKLKWIKLILLAALAIAALLYALIK